MTGDQAPGQGATQFGRLEGLDPRFHELVPPDARLEVLAEGFAWLEGPVWSKAGGHLLFSDTIANMNMETVGSLVLNLTALRPSW
ncbi:MAG: hypothetical protein P8X58_07840 [Syntrophobacterales bacterium]